MLFPGSHGLERPVLGKNLLLESIFRAFSLVNLKEHGNENGGGEKKNTKQWDHIVIFSN